MKTTWIPIVISGMLLQPLAFADVSYQETTQITGGSLQGMLKLAGAFSSQAKQANAPVTSTVALHGNRMVRSNPHTTEIIDLDQQAMTFIDHDKHTYSVSLSSRCSRRWRMPLPKPRRRAKVLPTPAARAMRKCRLTHTSAPMEAHETSTAAVRRRPS